MKNQVTSIEQSRLLIGLGVPAEKASMESMDGELKTMDECRQALGAGFGVEIVPVFTVADLLGMLPRELPNSTLGGYMARLAIDFIPDKVGICYLTGSYVMLKDHRAIGDDILTALIAEIEWLLSNGYKLEV